MKIDNVGLNFIKEVEGIRNNVYLDSAGLPTIGVGHLLTRDELSSGKILINGIAYRYKDGLSDHAIDQLLLKDLYIAQITVDRMVKVQLTQNQFNALVSFCFNVGRGAFINSTLLKRLNAGKHEAVPFELRRWKYAGGRVIQGLINRREKEIKMWNCE